MTILHIVLSLSLITLVSREEKQAQILVGKWREKERKRKRTERKKKERLENVAINDVLPLKAARRDAIANLKCFGASDTRDLISIVTFTFSMRRYLIRLA